MKYISLFCYVYSNWEWVNVPLQEAILIRVSDPSLNRNIDKYQLPHIWDEVLVKASELKLK